MDSPPLLISKVVSAKSSLMSFMSSGTRNVLQTAIRFSRSIVSKAELMSIPGMVYSSLYIFIRSTRQR